MASGQSNMERQLGLRGGQQPITDWEQEVAAANYPQIRQFYVPQTKSFTPQTTVKGEWTVCSPETVADFTAVGYFFARDLVRRAACSGRHHSQLLGRHAGGGVDERGRAAKAAGLCRTARPVEKIRRRSRSGAARSAGKTGRDGFEKWIPARSPARHGARRIWTRRDWKTMTLPTLSGKRGLSGFRRHLLVPPHV